MKFFLSFLLLCSSLFAESIHVLGIGAACIDYIFSVEDEFLHQIKLEKNGWKEVDFEEFSDLLNKAHDPLLFTGGCAANTIKGLANLGIKCSFLGSIGEDKIGEKITCLFKNMGISPLFIKKETKSSQIACFVTPDGARSFCAYIKPEKNSLENDINEELFKDIQLVHIEGYKLSNGFFFEKALHIAKNQNILVSIDLGSPNVAKTYRERIFSLLSFHSSIVFANEEEAFALTGLPPEQAALFLNNFCKVAVVKVGREGCFVASDKKCFQCKAEKTRVVDTTGAGDLFASGFLYGYLKGFPLEVCAKFANLAGGAVIENFGAEISKSRWTELKFRFEQIVCKQSVPSL